MNIPFLCVSGKKMLGNEYSIFMCERKENAWSKESRSVWFYSVHFPDWDALENAHLSSLHTFPLIWTLERWYTVQEAIRLWLFSPFPAIRLTPMFFLLVYTSLFYTSELTHRELTRITVRSWTFLEDITLSCGSNIYLLTNKTHMFPCLSSLIIVAFYF